MNFKRLHPNRKKMTVGRGGKRGKTSGRGTKGQKARSGRKIRPALRDAIKKIPRRRGVTINKRDHQFTSVSVPPVSLSLSLIEASYASGETVSPHSLIEKGLIKRVRGRIPKIKLLDGEISKKISFEKILLSGSAKKKIEAAGGGAQ
jgi:large subunit ribosomal protein L15